MKVRSAFLCAVLLMAIVPIGGVGSVAANPNQHSISIGANQYQHVALGQISAYTELTIDYSVNENIDVLLLNQAQYASWGSGGAEHIESGSDYDDDGDDYVYTITDTDAYHLVFDNSGQAGQASSSGTTVTGDATTTLSASSEDKVRTRVWVDVDSFEGIETPEADEGKVLSFDVKCDVGLTSTQDLDFLLLDSIQAATPGQLTQWNRHASFEDTCSHDWEYEVTKESGWTLLVDNSDAARTDGLSNAMTVDVEINVRSLLPLIEVVDTSRMIDSGDYYRVDLGFMTANSVIDIDFAFWSHGTAMLTDDLDVLVMTRAQANSYEAGSNVISLGHTTVLDASSQSWSYQFPKAGSYSIVFDNTDEPSGGAGDGSDVQVEIGVTSLTIPSLFGNLWTGWHQSRHYSLEGEHMALDFGSLSAGDDVYYYLDGINKGGSLFSSKEFDVMMMTKSNYDVYANGSSSFDVIDDGSNFKQGGLIPVIENISIPLTDQYVLVFDAADGPDSDSADENGDWIWEFIVLSEGGRIDNLQAQDAKYEESLSVGSFSTPDSDGDGVRNGKDACQNSPPQSSVDANGCAASERDSDGDGVSNSNDQCPNTSHGAAVNASGCAASQLDDDNDGVTNDQDQCPNTAAGSVVDSTGCELDDDGDGVANSNDLCANTAAGSTVDANGCATSQLDDDADGVSNDQDLCPNTAAGTTVDANGCEVQTNNDDDNDGVTNDMDVCPNTPAGTDVDAEGCEVEFSSDADGDGVNDGDDTCPGTAAGSSVDADGCADSQLDNDNDGVTNDRDACDYTSSRYDVDANGCAIVPEASDEEEANGIPGFSFTLAALTLLAAVFVRRD